MIVAADLVALLAAFGVFLICWLLLQGYRNTLGLLLGKIADETRDLVIASVHPFGWLAAGIDRINHFILYNLGQTVEASAWAWHKLVSQLASFVTVSMRLIAELAEATESEFARLSRHVIPQAIASALGPLTGLVYQFRRQLAHLAGQVASLAAHTLHVVTHEVTKQIIRVEHTVEVKTRTIVVHVAGAVGIPLPRVGALERDVKGIDETLRGVLRRLTPAGILGVVGLAIGQLGLSWTRCSGSQRYGKQLCGMDQDLLGTLISDTLLVLGTVDLVEFAEGMQGLTAEAAGAIGSFWRA